MSARLLSVGLSIQDRPPEHHAPTRERADGHWRGGPPSSHACVTDVGATLWDPRASWPASPLHRQPPTADGVTYPFAARRRGAVQSGQRHRVRRRDGKGEGGASVIGAARVEGASDAPVAGVAFHENNGQAVGVSGVSHRRIGAADVFYGQFSEYRGSGGSSCVKATGREGAVLTVNTVSVRRPLPRLPSPTGAGDGNAPLLAHVPVELRVSTTESRRKASTAGRVVADSGRTQVQRGALWEVGGLACHQ